MTVQATVHLSKADTLEALKHAIGGRIQALANVHTLFVQSRWTGAELHRLVTQELSPYRQDEETRVRIAGPNLMLEPDAAQTMALTVHELATNAAKYGALSVFKGRVEIEWSYAADRGLVVRRSAGQAAHASCLRHAGDGGLRGQLKGEMRFDWRAEGLACEIAMPV